MLNIQKLIDIANPNITSSGLNLSRKKGITIEINAA